MIRMKKWIAIIATLGLLGCFLYANQQWLHLTKYVITLKKLPKEMDGLKIVQISDLHHAEFGHEQSKLIEKVKNEKPDMIVITGDLVDRYHYDLDQSLEAVEGFVKIAPVYYVNGNHEVSLNDVPQITKLLKDIGVHVLENQTVSYYRNGAAIDIIGIDDPLNGKETAQMLNEALVGTDKKTFRLLLAHRPEYYQDYIDAGIDLTFNGHAHGGQIRVPGIGGLVDHKMNLFPTHIEGIERQDQLTQVISRGLGNSRVNLRIFNPPEIVVAMLHSEK